MHVTIKMMICTAFWHFLTHEFLMVNDNYCNECFQYEKYLQYPALVLCGAVSNLLYGGSSWNCMIFTWDWKFYISINS